jgi:hypothetical protein
VIVFLILFVVFSVLILGIRVLTTKLRILPDPKVIIASFERDPEAFAQRMDDVIPNTWSDITDDRAFLSDVGGKTGLRRIRNKAINLLDLVDSFKIPKGDARYVRNRAYGVSLFVLLCILGDFVRLLYPDLPHYSARVAAYLYWESRIRVCTLVAKYSPEHLDDLYSAL